MAANFRNKISATNEKSHHEVPKTLPCFLVGEGGFLFKLGFGVETGLSTPHR